MNIITKCATSLLLLLACLNKSVLNFVNLANESNEDQGSKKRFFAAGSFVASKNERRNDASFFIAAFSFSSIPTPIKYVHNNNDNHGLFNNRNSHFENNARLGLTRRFFTPNNYNDTGDIRSHSDANGIDLNMKRRKNLTQRNAAQSTHHRDKSQNQNANNSNNKQKKKRRNQQSKKKKITNQRSPLSAATSASASKQQQQQQQQPILKHYTNEQLSQMSIGQAIQEASTIHQLLITAASRMWIPTDDDLPPHIQHQSIHHEKRFRTSCLLLQKLSECFAKRNTIMMMMPMIDAEDKDDHDDSQSKQKEESTMIDSLWIEQKDFERVVLAATLPFESKSSSSSSSPSNIGSSGIAIEKECRFVTLALVALYTIAGYTLPPLPLTTTETTTKTRRHYYNPSILSSIQSLIHRAEQLAIQDLTLNQAVEVRWAIRGLFKRLPLQQHQHQQQLQTYEDNIDALHDQNNDNDSNNIIMPIMPSIPNLNHRVRKLPFDIIPQCIDWNALHTQYSYQPQSNDHDQHHHDLQYNNIDNSSNSSINSINSINSISSNNVIQTLLNEIPFQFDTITTRSGTLVKERRSTAWIAERGIGSLAYSGKLMKPHPIPPFVQICMRHVEQAIIEHDEHLYNHRSSSSNAVDIDGIDIDIHNGGEASSSSSSSSSLMFDQHHQQQQQHYSSQQLNLCVQTNGNYFDCALTNHYPDYESACKFHTDPEHGTFWERLTCVVSAGNFDVRKFAFRPIPQHNNNWAQWENDKRIIQHLKTVHGLKNYGDASSSSSKSSTGSSKSSTGSSNNDGMNIEPVVISMFPGDVVKMWGNCNDVFHHAVYGAEQSSDGGDYGAGFCNTNMSNNNNNNNKNNNNNEGRVSLVFKRAMDRGNGRKGHGNKGEGRRSRSRM